MKELKEPKFPNQIQMLMDRRGLKQADLCRKTGISSPLISNYVTGKVSPTIDKAIAIADALEVSLDELVGRNIDCDLTDDESALLSMYRELDAVGQSNVNDYLEFVHAKKILRAKSSDGAG